MDYDVEQIIHVLGKKNTVKLLKFCSLQERRFNEIKYHTSETASITSAKINELATFNLIDKIVHENNFTYKTTEKGIFVLEQLSHIIKKVGKIESGQIILECIKKVLKKISDVEYYHIESQLKLKYNMSLFDCVKNPTPLKLVLIEIYGIAAKSILTDISESISSANLLTKTKHELSKFVEDLT